MFTETEQTTSATVTVRDAWVGLQLLEKAAQNGVIQPSEFAVLSAFRNGLTEAIKDAIGKDYDTEVAKVRQAQVLAQQQARAQQAETDKEKTSEPEA